MIKLQTPVIDAPCKVGISYNDRILLMGSCFTDNIGKLLKNYGFDVCCNPFGTLYNPASILSSIKRLKSCTAFTSDDCIEIGAGDNRICSFYHHTSFAKATHDEFLEHANTTLKEASEFFHNCNKIIITCTFKISYIAVVAVAINMNSIHICSQWISVVKIKNYIIDSKISNCI